MRAESDACFGLGQGVDDSVVAQVGVDGHHGEVVLEGGVSGDQPLSSGLGYHGNWGNRKKWVSFKASRDSRVQEIFNTTVKH